jgi:two-component system sensor histidine kinase RegB
MTVQGAEPMGEATRSIAVADLLHEALLQFPEAQRACVGVDTPRGEMRVVLPVQVTVQSLVALVQNALDASREGGRVVLRATILDSQVTFEVRDDGHGMPEPVLRRIAEPFFTTKDPGKGMGLGTFLVRTFAERLGGGLAFESISGKGTTATLTLPLNSSRRDAHAAA